MRNSITDVAGVLVGQAQDHRLKTGVTVVTGDAPFIAGVHVMGGAPGTRETDLLAPDKTVQQVDAIVLSGGSAFGLAAADGVMAALRDAGRGTPVGPHKVPIVPAAILFDLMAGGQAWDENPFAALGRAAFEARGTDVQIGSVGAGTGATTATLKGGLGTASTRLPSGVTVGAIVAANPLGSVTVGNGPHFWAAPWEQGGEFGGRGVAQNTPTGWPATKLFPAQNTTIAVIATDAPLDQAGCQRLATAAHDGMARAIVPSHTPMDGDLVFALTTGTHAASDDMLPLLGHAAATTLARAIARAIYTATPAPGDVLPCWGDRFA